MKLKMVSTKTETVSVKIQKEVGEDFISKLNGLLLNSKFLEGIYVRRVVEAFEDADSDGHDYGPPVQVKVGLRWQYTRKPALAVSDLIDIAIQTHFTRELSPSEKELLNIVFMRSLPNSYAGTASRNVAELYLGDGGVGYFETPIRLLQDGLDLFGVSKGR